MDEPRRRTATLEAMRHGADFVVNGQLALGPLSGSANLLMRTSGYSDLGDYLYVPCDTQGKTNLHSAFRLCFLADLLHSLQGQLPPQMLIIRGGTDVVPLETEEHIYHYRAVKQRFMTAMREFRKHRMPDPAESSHFGRWSDCANEVLKQRALNAADEGAEDQLELQADDAAAPLLATADGNILATSPDTDSLPTSEVEAPPPRLASVAGDARRASDIQVQPDSGQTLA
jgi:predicted RecB family nuclease